ncbi:MAG: proline dehydrogenase family protein, partial [Acidimicrobiales bacterium]
MARAEAMAARLLNEANSRRGRGERRQGQRISRLLEDPEGLAFILALTDEVLRIRDRRRAAGHLRSLVSGFGSARFLGPVDRRLLLAGSAMAELAPFLVVPLVKARVRSELAGFVIPAESGPLGRHIARRHSEGASMNINLLGEAVLGDDEANNRLKAVIALLDRPDVDYVSVKFSSVCAQLNMVGFECEVERVAGRLRLLYEAAMRHRPHKFVNLDMEEYRDLDLTVAVFQRVLNEERYAGLDAGIVLQAYLPDSLGVMTKLTAWARERHRRAGATTRVRIVKGANLAMEGVEAELMGWPQAPFTTKAEVDANYKRMLDVALDPANSGALFLGIAGHNLFEIAWALTLSEHLHLKDMVEVEMLEGMAPSMAAAVRREAGALRLYAPIARRADNESVIAYLVRRFDENTGPDNFLRKQFSLRTGSGDWTAERDRFRASVAARHDVVVATRRTQDRRTDSPLPEGHPHAFFNVSDTDFSLATNRAWIGSCLGTLADHGIDVVPAVVGGRTVGPHDGSEGSFAPDRLAAGRDPSDPGRVAYRWVPATASLVDEAVHAARPAGDRWRRSSGVERRRTLIGVGASLARARGRLIGVMARDAGKTVA